MGDSVEPVIVVRDDVPRVTGLRRSSRDPTPSTKAREATLNTNNRPTATKRITKPNPRTGSTDGRHNTKDGGGRDEEEEEGPEGEEFGRLGDDGRSQARDRRAAAEEDLTAEQMMQAIVKEIQRQRRESRKQLEEARQQHEETRQQLKEAREHFQEYKRQMEEEVRRMGDEVKGMREKLENIEKSLALTHTNSTSPQASYAEIARTPPTSQPSNVRTLSSGNTTPSTLTDTLFCTVDLSRVDEVDKDKVTAGTVRAAIETEMRARKNEPKWRCKAVTRDARTATRIRIVCRDEGEQKTVKQVAETVRLADGVRVLRDEWFPVKVDYIKSAAVVDDKGKELPGAAEALGLENDTTVAKIRWLSGREGQDEEALLEVCQKLDNLLRDGRGAEGRAMQVVIVGDFNRHDHLWGGDNVTPARQGEADPIIDLMSEHSLQSTLPRGTITWEARHQRQTDSTIDLEAAKYLGAEERSTFDKLPHLTRADGTQTSTVEEQAGELLSTFFPPLPDAIEEEGQRPQRSPVEMPEVTFQEIETQLFRMKPWKAPGADGLPLMVWRQVWPAVKDRVLVLFRASIREGVLPQQWRHAKIVPLKKPGKPNYTVAKAWRPISLLSTLGKVLEAVIAERISWAVEEFGLLPTNHFGARKRRSAEQALMVLQEFIYKAWRNRQVVSLVSFDVKGAYNGVCKERLLQRLAARGIPLRLVRWIDAFCSGRTASIEFNGYGSEERDLPQAGLPQGSPLSPVLFLFFNADLVQHRIGADGGAIAFVDDYTAWVTGPTAKANREGIQSIVNEALAWGRRSGATFETDKTAIIHFSRNKERLDDDDAFTVGGQTVRPQTQVKILGVVMDQQLRFKQQVANAATKGLKAAMALRRLRGLAPLTARRLFTSAVAPVMDYASNIWRYSCGTTLIQQLNRVQRIASQAIIGTLRTVALAVAEAEAGIFPLQQRLTRRATRFWITLNTLPDNHPLARVRTNMKKRFASPLQRIAADHEAIAMDELEQIRPFALSPWEERLELLEDEKTTETMEKGRWWNQTVVITSASVKNGTVGIGAVIRPSLSASLVGTLATVAVTLGDREKQNLFTAELAAIHRALEALPESLKYGNIAILSRNKAAVLAASKPHQQSGQADIQRIYEKASKLRKAGNTISIGWITPDADPELMQAAKRAAQRSANPSSPPTKRPYRAASTTLAIAMRTQKHSWSIPAGVGKYSKTIDAALPGKHTRELYDPLTAAQAKVLAQLRTGMARLNGYLHQIKAVPG
ncbi:hypothetical protein QIS74_04224 [Colletotrichum tabaci]|uniref:Reverse transcriptase domain-containing protein n=1 Tax=Colletotrichum tabaci TaxID=1209068 RepID=A0AAV9TL58_9PEZI